METIHFDSPISVTTSSYGATFAPLIAELEKRGLLELTQPPIRDMSKQPVKPATKAAPKPKVDPGLERALEKYKAERAKLAARPTKAFRYERGRVVAF